MIYVYLGISVLIILFIFIILMTYSIDYDPPVYEYIKISYKDLMQSVNAFLLKCEEDQEYPNNINIESHKYMVDITAYTRIDNKRIELQLNMCNTVINNNYLRLSLFGYARYLIWLMYMNKYPKKIYKSKQKETIESLLKGEYK